MRFPVAAAHTPHLLVLDECGSTNAELRDRAKDAAAHPHFTVLLTQTQTAGRGRLERQWTTPPGSALAISVLLRDLPAEVESWGWIPLAAGVAMTDAVAAQLPGHEVGVKWPNDVLVDGKKICGILAEVSDGAVVLGAGVNTVMTAQQLPVPTATSFAALGVQVDTDRLLSDYLSGLREQLGLLSRPGAAQVHETVSARCVTLGRQVDVSLPQGTVLSGRAVRLAQDGCLIVEVDGQEQTVCAGDVVHVRPRAAN